MHILSHVLKQQKPPLKGGCCLKILKIPVILSCESVSASGEAANQPVF